MDYQAVLATVLALLQQEQRLSYRVLKLRLQLDDDTLEALKEDLIYAKKLAVDEEGRVLVWAGSEASLPQPASPPATPVASDAERRQLTVLFCDLVDSTALAHQRGQACAASRFQTAAGHTLIQYLINLQRLGKAFQERRAERLAGKEAVEQLQGGSTDHQRIGRGQPLQAGGQVGGLAEGQLFLPGAAPHVTHHHQTGMDPQTHGQLHAPLLPQTGIELAQGLYHPQPGAHRPLGVVFVGQGVAKID